MARSTHRPGAAKVSWQTHQPSGRGARRSKRRQTPAETSANSGARSKLNGHDTPNVVQLIDTKDNKQPSDETPVARYAAGEVDAFEPLYQRHKQGLYRFLRHGVRHSSTADELFQDVWMKIVDARRSYRREAQFSTWIYGIAHNRLIDHYRRGGVRRRFAHLLGSSEVSPALETEIEFSAVHARLGDAPPVTGR